MKTRFFRRADIAVAAVICLLSAGLLLWISIGKSPAGDPIVQIEHNGKKIDEFRLSEFSEETELSYPVADGEILLTVDADGVAVTSSPCVGHTCVKCGRISAPGESIVCLPMRFSVTISGGNVDAVTG